MTGDPLLGGLAGRLIRGCRCSGSSSRCPQASNKSLVVYPQQGITATETGPAACRFPLPSHTREQGCAPFKPLLQTFVSGTTTSRRCPTLLHLLTPIAVAGSATPPLACRTSSYSIMQFQVAYRRV